MKTITKILMPLVLILIMVLVMGCPSPTTPDLEPDPDPVVITVPINLSNLTLTVLSSTMIEASFTDNSTNETKFELEWCKDISFPEAEKDSVTIAANTDEDTKVKHTIMNLDPESIYYVRCRAVNSAGGSDWIMQIVTTPVTPEGTATINNGAEKTNTEEVEATLNFVGITEMEIYNENETAPGYIPYADIFPITLPPGDGVKNVIFNLKDSAGNITNLTDSIILDKTPAIINSLSINNTETGITNKTTVSLEIDVTGAVRFQFRLNGGSWNQVAEVERMKWTLSDTSDGLKEFDFQFFDDAENMTEGYASIELDTTPPATWIRDTIDIMWHNYRERTIRVWPSEAYRYRIRIVGYSDWFDWVYEEEINLYYLILPDNDGIYTIEVEGEDLATNINHNTTELGLDRVAPSDFNVQFAQDLTYGEIVNLNYNTSETDLKYVHGGYTSGANDFVVNYISNPDYIRCGFSNATEDAVHTMYIYFTDKAGNNSLVYSDTIYVDAVCTIEFEMDRLIVHEDSDDPGSGQIGFDLKVVDNESNEEIIYQIGYLDALSINSGDAHIFPADTTITLNLDRRKSYSYYFQVFDWEGYELFFEESPLVIDSFDVNLTLGIETVCKSITSSDPLEGPRATICFKANYKN